MYAARLGLAVDRTYNPEQAPISPRFGPQTLRVSSCFVFMCPPAASGLEADEEEEEKKEEGGEEGEGEGGEGAKPGGAAAAGGAGAGAAGSQAASVGGSVESESVMDDDELGAEVVDAEDLDRLAEEREVSGAAGLCVCVFGEGQGG